MSEKDRGHMDSKKTDAVVVVALPPPSMAELALKSGKNTADIIGSAFPVIGAALSTAVGMSLDRLYQQRVAEFVDQVNRAFHDIPEKVYESEAFAEGTRRTLNNFLDESSRIKRDNLFAIYAYFVKHGSERTAQHNATEATEVTGATAVTGDPLLETCLLWEKIAAGISEDSFHFFLEIKAMQDARGRKNWQDWWGTLPARTLQSVYIGELVATGLIEEQIHQSPHAGGVEQKKGYTVSPAGEEFLIWLGRGGEAPPAVS